MAHAQPSPGHKMSPTQRFSDRVENYMRYRPGYPPQLVTHLRDELSVEPPGPIADIGSGTGLLSRPLLEAGYTVLGVEPNAEMRAAGDGYLARFPAFTSVPGKAEETLLPARSCAAIVAGQSFHWFDAQPTRAEFARILQPGGWVLLIWNDRETDTTPFLREYEALLNKHCPDYANIGAQHAAEQQIADFFAPAAGKFVSFPNEQVFDYEGLEGRLLSSSYAPNEGARRARMLRDLHALFDKHEADGRLHVIYQTKVFHAQL